MHCYARVVFVKLTKKTKLLESRKLEWVFCLVQCLWLAASVNFHQQISHAARQTITLSRTDAPGKYD